MHCQARICPSITESIKTCARWAISSGSTPRATIVGCRRNFSLAKATARRARRVSSQKLFRKIVTGCISTASRSFLPVLDFSTISFNPGNDLPYIFFLPTETATAWYHKKLASDLQADQKKALSEAEQFALGPYTLALTQGAGLPASQRAPSSRNCRA